jgi:hypothetical protein
LAVHGEATTAGHGGGELQNGKFVGRGGQFSAGKEGGQFLASNFFPGKILVPSLGLIMAMFGVQNK